MNERGRFWDSRYRALKYIFYVVFVDTSYKINFNVMQQNAMLLVDQYVVGLPLIG